MVKTATQMISSACQNSAKQDPALDVGAKAFGHDLSHHCQKPKDASRNVLAMTSAEREKRRQKRTSGRSGPACHEIGERPGLQPQKCQYGRGARPISGLSRWVLPAFNGHRIRATFGQISISIPISTTCATGMRKYAPDSSALRCINTYMRFLHARMPAERALETTVARPR
jgi:hypothetical protein